MRRFILPVMLWAALPIGAAKAACTVPNTLTNGTTADATLVMANFTSITSCAAQIANPSFTGSMTLGNGSGISDLAVNGGTGSGNGSQYTIQINGTGRGWLANYGRIYGSTSSDIVLVAATGGSLHFASNGATPQLMLHQGGSLLFGTTTNGGWAGSAKAEFRGGIGQNTLSAYNTGNGNAILARYDTAGGAFAAFFFGASSVGGIDYSGGLTRYLTTSDERLKDWSVYQRDYSSIIRQLWVGDFHWRKSGEIGFGYRAQQAYPLFPAAVHKPQGEGQWQMDYGKTAPLALWGVKDLYRRNDQQAEEIAAVRQESKAMMLEIAQLKDRNRKAVSQIADLRAELNQAQSETIEALNATVEKLEQRLRVHTASN